METAEDKKTFETHIMQELARYIETHSDEALTLGILAKKALLSPSHLQRRFKEIIGVSPKEYQEACRLRNIKRQLAGQENVTTAMYEAGYNSPSRLYEKVESRFGMTPRQYQTRGKALDISYATASTPLGLMMLAATDRGLCFIQFGESEAALQQILVQEFKHATLHPMAPTQHTQFDAWITALNRYLKTGTPAPDLPLDISGTAFQLKVWKYLQTIPQGNTITYAKLADAVGSPKAIRAAASACARNRIAVVIPCHRVIRGNGNLAGYRWGLERKEKLLALEKKASAK